MRFSWNFFVASLFLALSISTGSPAADDAGASGDPRRSAGGSILPNGIELPPRWPPRLESLPRVFGDPPYLKSPPKVIAIDGGRQLFVDDFLIESTTLKRTYHQASYRMGPPPGGGGVDLPVVLKPDRPWEITPPSPCAMVFSDGVFYDPKDGFFKMWYMAGYVAGTGYATSRDGIRWEKPILDVVPGTNLVQKGRRDSSTVWLDHAAKDPRERFKMGFYRDGALLLSISPDGIHWTEPVKSGPTGDRTTFFYSPFREAWVYSLRAGIPGDPRVRRYHEAKDFLGGARWKSVEEPTLWVGADDLDPPRVDLKTRCQLYNLDCFPYESLLVGLFDIWRGQPKDRPKPNEICLGFSRDGFHWSRPDRRPFIPVSERQGDWNWGNVQSAGGGCLIVGRQLWFYVSARAGVPGSATSGACVTGLATLRRDGFASLDAGSDPGQVTTRPVRFRGKHLFVNADVRDGSLRAEVLDEGGSAIEPFTLSNCETIGRMDGTELRIRWRKAADLSAVAGRGVRLRFEVAGGKLYSFWVSPEESGASFGHVAAGGPGFGGPIDDVGNRNPALDLEQGTSAR
jgi:hypothetical protein